MIIGSEIDYSAFEYVVRFTDCSTGEQIAPDMRGWSSFAVDPDNDGVYVRNSFIVEAADLDGYSPVYPATEVTISVPETAPQDLLGMTYEELCCSAGGKSTYYVWQGQGRPLITDDMIDAYVEGISPYNVVLLPYEADAGAVHSSTQASAGCPEEPVHGHGGDVYAGADLPQRSIEFDVVLGYEYSAASSEYPSGGPFEDGIPHSRYWTASFDFSGSIEDGFFWPYGDDAVIGVTFYFSDGSASDIGTVKASKTVCYPVFEVDGRPYVADVVCTPDLWPSDGKYCYPVQVEAVIYSPLYNDTGVNNQV